MKPELKKHILSHPKEVFRCKIFRAIENKLTHALTSSEMEIYTIRFSDWVNVIPITPEGEIVLVKQHRYGTDSVTLETPGGAVSPDEKDLTMAALRELEEETGYTTQRILALPGMAPNPAVQSNRITYFLALDVQLSQDRKHFPDEFEHLEIIKMPFEDAVELVRTAQINHALAALGILLAQPYFKQRPSPQKASSNG